MDVAATISKNSSFKENCENCNAVYLVSITEQAGHNEREEYYCPTCKKENSERASLPIKVTLIKEGIKKEG